MDEIGKNSGSRHITGNRKILDKVDFEKNTSSTMFKPIKKIFMDYAPNLNGAKFYKSMKW